MPRVARTNGQRFFLTYSQAADICQSELADFLHNLADADNWLELCQENHQQEGIHYHVVICFEDRFQHPLDVFDFGGCHPNIQPIKNGGPDLLRCRHYLRKGENRRKEDEHSLKEHKNTPCDYTGEVIDRGQVPVYVCEAGRFTWSDILSSSTDTEDFLSLCKKHRTADYVLRHQQLRDFADYEFSKVTTYTPQFPRESYIIPPDLDEWVKEVFSEVSFIPARSHEPPFVN